MPALQNWQVQLSDWGVVLGGEDPPIYKLETIEGLDRDTRGQDVERVQGDGTIGGPDYAAGKLVTLVLHIVGTSPGNAIGHFDALARDWGKARGTEDEQPNIPLRFKLPGRVTQQLRYGRPRRLAADYSMMKYSLIRCVATYYARDPKITSDELHVVDIPYGTSQVLQNLGNHPAQVQWDVYGSATNPRVERNGSRRFELGTAMASGDFYRVNVATKTVQRNSDGANLYPTFSGHWLEVPPGGASFAVTRAAGSGPYVRASYRDTWL